ncbi:MAG: addiction module toxin, HicA family [Gemmatimonas sp.]|nr:addiction module toxin, HicA family [Gemmatimonas sp.]
MAKLPVVSARDVVRMLGKVGYAFDRQKGSHIILRQPTSPFRRITVPDHREIARGTLRAIIRQSGLTVDEFVGLL